MSSGRAFATTVPGLASLLADEARSLGLEPGATGNDGRADIVELSSVDWAAASRVRTAEALFATVARFAVRPAARDTAEQLAVAGLKARLDDVRAVAKRRYRRVRLIVRVRDERRFTRQALRRALTVRLGSLATTDETPDVAELWILQTSTRQFLAGLRVPLPSRTRVAERPGALRPQVAAAMVQRVERPGTLVDPCCGTATIALMASAMSRAAVSGDLDPQAIAAARANGVTSLLQLDARRLPFTPDVFAAVVTNLPFGRQHQVQGAPVAWYRRVVGEGLRVAPQVVVLAAPTAPFRQALGRFDARLDARFDLDLLGNRTAIWDIRR